MDFTVISTSSVPLYLQIAEYIKKNILAGDLKEGDLLPSVRVLSRQLNVSIITTRRAYTDLESEGFVESVPAKGTFVSFNHVERLRELGYVKLEDKLREAIQIAKLLDMDSEEVVEVFNVLYQDN